MLSGQVSVLDKYIEHAPLTFFFFLKPHRECVNHINILVLEPWPKFTCDFKEIFI